MDYDDCECLWCYVNDGCKIQACENRYAVCMECLLKLKQKNCETKVMMVLRVKPIDNKHCFLCHKKEGCKINITMCLTHAGENAEKCSSQHPSIDAPQPSPVSASPPPSVKPSSLAFGDKVRWGREVFLFCGFLNGALENSIVSDGNRCFESTCYCVKTVELKAIH